VFAEITASRLSAYEWWLLIREVEVHFLTHPRKFHLWESLAALKVMNPIDDWDGQLMDLVHSFDLLPGFLFAEESRFAVELSTWEELVDLLESLPHFEYGIVGADFRFLLVESEHEVFYVGAKIQITV